MKTLIIFLLLTSTAQAQQRSMPPWPDPREWGPEEQERRLPPPRPRGPQVVPCIYYGDCKAPRQQYQRPRFQYPRYYDLYEGE
jgi:hypothetical protein